MMWTTKTSRAAALVTVAAALAAGPVQPQALYKYLDDNGRWVFSDRQPSDGSSFDRIELPREHTPGVVRLYERSGVGAVSMLAAENSFYGTAQIAFRIVAASNLAVGVPLRGNRILDPRSDTTLFELTPDDARRPVRVQFEYQYIHGDPRARHTPDGPYRLPFAPASRYRVSQAFPDTFTHVDRANTYAVDFEMPVGTNVFAARGGVVLDVADDFYEAGIDERLTSRANLVRILHDDGTIALYAHLNWNSIRVAPGQAVARGEYIADSGNTGFSTGPHLHFVVQRNIGGELGSVPIEFATVGGEAVELATGDMPVAY